MQYSDWFLCNYLWNVCSTYQLDDMYMNVRQWRFRYESNGYARGSTDRFNELLGTLVCCHWWLENVLLKEKQHKKEVQCIGPWVQYIHVLSPNFYQATCYVTHMSHVTVCALSLFCLMSFTRVRIFRYQTSRCIKNNNNKKMLYLSINIFRMQTHFSSTHRPIEEMCFLSP